MFRWQCGALRLLAQRGTLSSRSCSRSGSEDHVVSFSRSSLVQKGRGVARSKIPLCRTRITSAVWVGCALPAYRLMNAGQEPKNQAAGEVAAAHSRPDARKELPDRKAGSPFLSPMCCQASNRCVLAAPPASLQAGGQDMVSS